MWERHEEKWPASESSGADASMDEPGSWRGEAGHYLNAEENLVSAHEHERIQAVEEKLSLRLEEIRREVPGVQFAGFEHRLKGEDRFKEKIADDLRATPEFSISQAAQHIPDALRYTFQTPGTGYSEGYRQICGLLEREGYEPLLTRNLWGDVDYKGVNTRWRDPTGHIFEVQFHTPESYQAKQITHPAYERLRTGSSAEGLSPELDDERPELEAFQRTVTAHIPIPPNTAGIPNFRKDGY
jgi:predicted metal-dependent phosphoesterase TrpH